jgi:glycosyltransferase involved in cell wall biosynthesis
MVIGFDGSRCFVKHKTGTENYAYQLLRHLAQIDKTNQYVIYLRPGNVVEKWDEETDASLARHSREGGNPIHNRSPIKPGMTNKKNDSHQNSNYGWPSNFQFRLLNYPKFWTQVGLALQTFIDPLDILFVPSHTLPLIRKPGLKTVMTVHDLGAEYLPGMHQLKQRLYLRLMTKIQLKTASKLIAVSQATKIDLVKKVGVKLSQIEVVYEGLNSYKKNDIEINKERDYDRYSYSNNDRKYHEELLALGLEKNKYFLFVGTIQPRKNLARLIKAYAGFLNINGKKSAPKLVLAGGEGWLSDSIYELPKKLGIENQVFFTGRISDARLFELYQNALAFTFPSLFEGFGLPVLEAFSFGVPIITSNSSSLPEVAGDAALLVNPTSTEEIMEAMLTLYNENELRTDLSKKGREQLKKFSWEKCAKETLNVLEMVVSK